MIPLTKRLMIYLGESDVWHHQASHLAILEFLKREGCAGATVVRGIAGFGASSRIHTTAILRLSMDLPVVITVVDRADRIERVLPRLKEMVGSGLMTIEDIGVVKYTPILKHGLPNALVRDLMTSAVESVTPDTPISRVLEILIDKDYTALPVVDAERRVVGMVGDTDLLASGEMSMTLSIPRAGGAGLFEQMLGRLRRSTTRVGAVMRSPAVTVRADAAIGEAARLMVAEGLKRLPVVGEDGRLEGVLGRLDLLKTMASVHLPLESIRHGAAGGPAGHLIVDVMSRDVPTVAADAALDEVIDLVVGSAAKRVVVIDGERRPVGIITDTDLVQRLSPDAAAGFVEIVRSKIPIESIGGEARRHLGKIRGTHAGEVMTAPVVTVREDTPFADALTVSAEKHVKRFPVVDAQGRLVGMVGRMELLAGFLRASGRAGA
jgi:CBS-domain-containing membrane protein